MKAYLLFLTTILAILGGCYQISPREGEISTVPVTNNPHAMPGPMPSSPLPAAF